MRTTVLPASSKPHPLVQCERRSWLQQMYFLPGSDYILAMDITGVICIYQVIQPVCLPIWACILAFPYYTAPMEGFPLLARPCLPCCIPLSLTTLSTCLCSCSAAVCTLNKHKINTPLNLSCCHVFCSSVEIRLRLHSPSAATVPRGRASKLTASQHGGERLRHTCGNHRP